ncbi:MAG: adenosylmethionine--8-amino-7-oxononanoate transaminase [Actinobacteria bacterium]|nr:adenosylmethionine--8-amino-7-oxononanoate transaminase [Actinomycetota bacterium]
MTDLVARDRAHVWHPYASVVQPSPLYEVVAAQGCRLTLADGRELVDGMSSWWAAIHGYRHPDLDAALHAQVARFAHVMFGGLTHAPAVELAELLVEITPPELTRVFFADSGSVAIEVAVKMALQYWQGRGQPQRTVLLTIRGGYHGDTAGAMSICDPVTGMHGLFSGYVAQQLFVSRPRPTFDEEVREEDLDEVRQALADRGSEIAAVVLEPVVQGAGGMRFYSPDYLRRLVALCRESGVLVLFDEIATGFGRTGTLFAMEHAGVVPDILCVGKALTGGYMTLGATLCTDEVAAGVCAPPGNALMHGPTFMANPLACSVALASVRLLLDSPWQQRVASIEVALREQLAPCRELPGVVDVRVLGAIGVVEVAEPVDMATLQPALVDRGAWVRPFGRLVYTMPPYVISPDELRVVTGAITSALQN